MASGLHSQHITNFNYGGGTFELACEGDALQRISVASGLHSQPTVDFNYSGGAFKLAREGDALIQESQWPPARIPNNHHYDLLFRESFHLLVLQHWHSVWHGFDSLSFLPQQEFEQIDYSSRWYLILSSHSCQDINVLSFKS
jgi:hypothetical protein